jgi:hypothetical protein
LPFKVWFADGVGFVKQEVGGDLGAFGVQLVSYQVA